MAPIPSYTIDGILPPYVGTDPGGSPAQMSPYRASLVDFVERFATTPERIEIAEGFLRYRSELRKVGITEGFQWVDGSYVEDVENALGRPPNDVDIVTFVAATQTSVLNALAANRPDLIKKSLSKHSFKCDVHFVPIGYGPEFVITQTRYFVLLFSHQRTSELWKGLVELSLDSSDDALAGDVLAKRGAGP